MVSPVAKTAMDALQAKHSAATAGYNPMVVDRHDLYRDLLEEMMRRIHQEQPSKPKRQQTPLVNAGYASRVLAMSHRIQAFLLYHQVVTTATMETTTIYNKRIQLVFLGCGLDVIGLWAAKSFLPTTSLDLSIIEVDTREIYEIKRDLLGTASSGSVEMVEHLTEHDAETHYCSGKIKCAQDKDLEDGFCQQQDSHYHDYVLIPADLTKETSRLDDLLQDFSIPFSPSAPTLVVSELVLAYLPPIDTNRLLSWCADTFSSIPGSAIVAIEPLGHAAPQNNDEINVVSVQDGYRTEYCQKFQDKMQRGKSNTTAGEGGESEDDALFFPVGTSVDSVTRRLNQAGYAKASTTTLGIAATIAAAATSPDKTLVCPEMFDEHAALALHLQSYVMTCGISSNENDDDASVLLFGQVMCPWECGSNALRLARSCLPWFDCFDQMVYNEIQLEHEEQARALFETTYREHMEDYPAIRKMVKGALKKELKATYSTTATTSSENGPVKFFKSSSIADFYRANNGIFLVAVRYGLEETKGGSEVVGFVGVRTCEAKDVETGTMEIFRLAVDERYRGRGIARNLLAAVEMFAMNQGCPKLVANTLTILEAACNLYASQGFVPEKETPLGLQLDMTTYIKVPFSYAEEELDESIYPKPVDADSPEKEQSDFDRLGYEQAEPTVHQTRRRGSLLGHLMAWADTVNEEHMETSFGQLKDCESSTNTSRRPRRGYGRRGSMDAALTDTDPSRNGRKIGRVRSSDDMNDSDSDENAAYARRRLGSERRGSLDAFVEQAVAYRNLRADPNDDEMNPFGARRDSLF